MKSTLGYEMRATDGVIGGLKDYYFDDLDWLIRYLVVDTGKWLPGRRVLVSPRAMGEPDWSSESIPVDLSKAAIENAPSIAEDEPVSKEFEAELTNYYDESSGKEERLPAESPVEHNLRSMCEVMGYTISAADGEIGHVEDFLMNPDDRTIPFFIVDTKDWLPGKKVILGTNRIDRVSWRDNAVSTYLAREVIEQAPEFDPAQPVNPRLELRLYDYYGRPTGLSSIE